jgi:hypothetical protein
MALAPGTRIGQYEIAAPIGAGGMGEVYRARDGKLLRDVALKILPDAFASDPDRLARFKREAQVLASLNHPNIAAIYGIEEGPAEAGHDDEGPPKADTTYRRWCSSWSRGRRSPIGLRAGQCLSRRHWRSQRKLPRRSRRRTRRGLSIAI